MIKLIIGGVVLLGVFIFGVLFARKNKTKVETAVTVAKEVEQKVEQKIEEVKK